MPATLATETYNGWANYETWNVALWIQNDQGLNTLAYESGSYEDFLSVLEELNIVATPDGVRYADPEVNAIELNADVFDFWYLRGDQLKLLTLRLPLRCEGHLKPSKPNSLFFQMQITSSAINNIAISDDKVTVTFVGDRSYDYACHDVAGFQNDLNDVIYEGESVGRFVNTAIRAQLLQAVWDCRGVLYT